MSVSGLPKAGAVLGLDGLEGLIDALADRGYAVLGPVERDGAIVTGPITGIGDLPAGRADRQEAGTYRLTDRDDGALFGYAVGPGSWKRQLHRPVETLFRVRRIGEELAFEPPPEKPPRTAFLGVRACELAAIAVQDRVLQGGRYVNTEYAGRRANVFLVAVNCGDPAATCFCASLDTGPRARRDYDIALTELLDGRHEFLAEPGSDSGAALLAYLPTRPATAADWQAAEAVAGRAAANMQRHMPTEGLKETLQQHPEHPRWDDVGERCLACANCTMVCPTCFCTTIEDRSDLDGQGAERVRRWDSCFNGDFSYVHGGAVRTQTRSRYRQWMTHKLAHWWDQFGSSGCVGCGRCIAWCPAGIDITAEAAAFMASREEGQAHGDA
jgi:formate hydrogenlyase subunit 6/NADH:ubiquinone oxidoreductase subunit I